MVTSIAGLVNAGASLDLALAMQNDADFNSLKPGDAASFGLDLSASLPSSTIAGRLVPWGGRVAYVEGWQFGDAVYKSGGVRWTDGTSDDDKRAHRFSAGVLYLGRTVVPGAAPSANELPPSRRAT